MCPYKYINNCEELLIVQLFLFSLFLFFCFVHTLPGLEGPSFIRTCLDPVDRSFQLQCSRLLLQLGRTTAVQVWKYTLKLLLYTENRRVLMHQCSAAVESRVVCVKISHCGNRHGLNALLCSCGHSTWTRTPLARVTPFLFSFSVIAGSTPALGRV